MARLVKIYSKKGINKFCKSFQKTNGYSVPASYLMSGDVWCLADDSGEIVGGYAIVNGNSRSLDQVPDPYVIKDNNYYYIKCNDISVKRKDIAEFTCYFMTSKDGRLKLTLHLIFNVLFSRREKYFAYSFTSSNKKLADYYGYGNPTFVYNGLPVRLEGHPEHPESEQVEMLTKFGILKVFLARIKNKYLRR